MTEQHFQALLTLVVLAALIWMISGHGDPSFRKYLIVVALGCVAFAGWQLRDLSALTWFIFISLAVVAIVLTAINKWRQIANEAREKAEEQDIALMHGLGQY